MSKKNQTSNKTKTKTKKNMPSKLSETNRSDARSSTEKCGHFPLIELAQVAEAIACACFPPKTPTGPTNGNLNGNPKNLHPGLSSARKRSLQRSRHPVPPCPWLLTRAFVGRVFRAPSSLVRRPCVDPCAKAGRLQHHGTNVHRANKHQTRKKMKKKIAPSRAPQNLGSGSFI